MSQALLIGATGDGIEYLPVASITEAQRKKITRGLELVGSIQFIALDIVSNDVLASKYRGNIDITKTIECVHHQRQSLWNVPT